MPPDNIDQSTFLTSFVNASHGKELCFVKVSQDRTYSLVDRAERTIIGITHLQDFSTLDAGLQQAFVSYLEERGIDAAMGEYLMSAHEVKEQKEYVNWLARIQKFLGKK